MNKPASLRLCLQRSVRFFAQNPDKLRIFIDKGSVFSTGVPGLSFEYRYTLTLNIIDFPEHSDNIIIPVLAWLTENQPEMLQNPDLMERGFHFDAEILNNNTSDMEFRLLLTERVGVRIVDGVYRAIHFDEPKLIGDDGVNWEAIYIPGVVDEDMGDTILTGYPESEMLMDGTESYVEYQ